MNVGDLPTGTVTFLFTDIEGSTRLLARLGGEYEATLDGYRRVIRAAVARHGGREVDTQGDGFFIAFPESGSAIAAAVEVQRELAATGGVRVRCGLHTGTPTARADGYVGLDVHLAARVGSAANGGQILASDATVSTLKRTAWTWSTVDLGEHRLKDFDEPIRLHQVVAPDLERDFPPLRVPGARLVRLPAPANPLVGRDTEIESAATLLLEGARVLTVTGPGGSGKTRFAIELASTLVDAFDDGVVFVDLADVNDPQAVSTTVARALGLREHGGAAIEVTLATFLGSRRFLLVLDNFEHLLDAAPMLSTLLAAAPRTQALVTSRAVLRIGGEHNLPLGGLALEDAESLFLSRAEAARPGSMHRDVEETARRLVERLDGLPLAVELAAARLGASEPSEILASLQTSLASLGPGRRDSPDRHRSLRATLDWSYALLKADERLTFDALGVFRGGFEAAAVDVIAGSGASDAIPELVEWNLVHPRSDGRYTMLETIRAYAEERSSVSSRTGALYRQHASYFLGRARTARAAFGGEGGPKELARLRSDHANLRAAFDRGDPATKLELAALIGRLWFHDGRLTEVRALLAEGLATDAGEPAIRSLALFEAAYIANWQGDRAEAQSRLLELKKLVSETDDGRVLARSLLLEGLLGVWSTGADHAELVRAAGLFREADEPADGALALNVAGLAALMRGDPDAAEQLLTEAFLALRDRGDTTVAALVRLNHVLVMFARGTIPPARPFVRDGLALAVAGENRHALLVGLICASILAVNDGQHETGTRLLGAGEALGETMGVGPLWFGRREYDRSIEIATGALGEPRFDQMWSAGRALSTDEALDLALPVVAQRD